MNRRRFIAALGAAAGFALDPERALWVPGAKTISIPRPREVAFLVSPWFVAIKPGGRFTISSRNLLNPERW